MSRSTCPSAISSAIASSKCAGLSNLAFVEAVPPRSLRQFAGLAAASLAGMPVKVVSARLGHANVSITPDVYQSVMPGARQAAADQVDLLHGPIGYKTRTDRCGFRMNPSGFF